MLVQRETEFMLIGGKEDRVETWVTNRANGRASVKRVVCEPKWHALFTIEDEAQGDWVV